MDDIPHSSIAKERHFFLSKLKTQPRFAIKHLRTLSQLVINRYHQKILTALRTKHRGHKRFPHFLPKLRRKHFLPALSSDQLLQRIPLRSLIHVQPVCETDIVAIAAIEDPEIYLAKQRWGKLVLDCVNGQQENAMASINQWMTSLPRRDDPAWETYSTCERVANLLTWLSVLTPAQRQHLDADACLHFLSDALHWIYTHLEFYGHGSSNHILNNARTLIMGGLVLNQPLMTQAGLTLLRQMLPLFIHNDGSLRERSSHYQLIVFTWLLDAYHFLNTYAWPITDDLNFVHDYCQRMCATASLLCNDDGELITFIGDISPDASPALTCARLSAFYPTFWPTTPPHTSIRDDWILLRTRQNHLILNCPQGNYPLPYPTHAHADITSFIWHHQTQPVLIDPGRIRYTKDPIATQQKSALAHNLLLINDFAPFCESFVIQGNWCPTPYANAHIHVTTDMDRNIHIVHNGYQRATPVTQHQRHIYMPTEDQLCIVDTLDGVGDVVATLLWQLDPSFIAFDANSQCLTSHHYQLHLATQSDNGTLHIQFFRDHDSHTWCSTRYGVAIKNAMILTRYQLRLPAIIKTVWRITPCVA